MNVAHRTEPVSRRGRAAKAPLSRALIVETGLAILDSEGMDALTMRRVGQELDTGAASLYVYVENRGALLTAMLDEALTHVEIPEASEGEWRERLALLVERATAEMARHPRLALVAFGDIPTRRPFLVIGDAIIGMLREGGLDDLTIAWAVDLIYLHITAGAAELSAYIEKAGGTGSEQAVLYAAEEALQATPHDDLVQLASLNVGLLEGSGDERAAWALRVMLNGILSTPAQRL